MLATGEARGRRTRAPVRGSVRRRWQAGPARAPSRRKPGDPPRRVVRLPRQSCARSRARIRRRARSPRHSRARQFPPRLRRAICPRRWAIRRPPRARRRGHATGPVRSRPPAASPGSRERQEPLRVRLEVIADSPADPDVQMPLGRRLAAGRVFKGSASRVTAPSVSQGLQRDCRGSYAVAHRFAGFSAILRRTAGVPVPEVRRIPLDGP
jgi:hypothetical protein